MRNYGDLVIITDKKKKQHMFNITEGKEFHTDRGMIKHDDLLNVPEGGIAQTSLGKAYTLYTPTYIDFVMNIKRQAQIIYPKDSAAMLMWGDVRPGQKVLESGIGQGALSVALLQALAGTGHLTSIEIREDFLKQSKGFIKMFLEGVAHITDLEERHQLICADVYEGFEGSFDRVFLDLPEPWRVVPHMKAGLVNGGLAVSYLPNVPQVQEYVQALRMSRYFTSIEIFELILRPWKVEERTARPEIWMYNHSAFIIKARKTAVAE